MLLADTYQDEAPKDPFKTMYSKMSKKTEVVDKVNHTTYHQKKNEEDEIMAEHEGPGIRKSHNYRWTTVEN